MQGLKASESPMNGVEAGGSGAVLIAAQSSTHAAEQCSSLSRLMV